MGSKHVEAFVDSLAGIATAHETTADEFERVLADVIEKPAVGTPLSFEGVSLAETPVNTTFSPSELEQATTGVTPATLGISEYGTVSVPSDAAGSELVSLYTPRHVAIVGAESIEPGMKAAYERLDEETEATDTQVLATGPSATADMGTLIEGVHGPDEVHVIVVIDR